MVVRRCWHKADLLRPRPLCESFEVNAARWHCISQTLPAHCAERRDREEMVAISVQDADAHENANTRRRSVVAEWSESWQQVRHASGSRTVTSRLRSEHADNAFSLAVYLASSQLLVACFVCDSVFSSVKSRARDNIETPLPNPQHQSPEDFQLQTQLRLTKLRRRSLSAQHGEFTCSWC